MISPVLAHFIGDYLLQSHNIAIRKTSSSFYCLAHVLLYTLPFLLITKNWLSLLIIASSHFVIDRYRLAVYINIIKNWALSFDFKNPMPKWNSFGFPSGTPEHISFWLLIITDNLLHIVCNMLALKV